MLITPVHIKKEIEVRNFTPVFGKIPVRRTDTTPILEQLGLLDLKDILYAYSAALAPLAKIGIHKDYQYPSKWSLLIAPIGNESVALEILQPLPNAEEKIVLTPTGNPSISYRDEDCEIIESWNLNYGSCYFNPTDVWHRAVNLVNRPQIVFSLRSNVIEIDEVLKRIT